MTWQLSLQYFGVVFVVASLFVFGAMALGRKPDYKQTFVAVWMFTVPIWGAWIACALEIAILQTAHHPTWLLAIPPVALSVLISRRLWRPYLRRLAWERYCRRREAEGPWD
ncbi:MAG TPA: hypothetical protein VNY05_30155 [Candidatus Acidoferrales bacterium]|nr:hypothetical protein [Candidatus Acidoferrales bacterium]